MSSLMGTGDCRLLTVDLCQLGTGRVLIRRSTTHITVGRERVGERLQVNSVAEIFKRVVEFVGMDKIRGAVMTHIVSIQLCAC